MTTPGSRGPDRCRLFNIQRSCGFGILFLAPEQERLSSRTVRSGRTVWAGRSGEREGERDRERQRERDRQTRESELGESVRDAFRLSWVIFGRGREKVGFVRFARPSVDASSSCASNVCFQNAASRAHQLGVGAARTLQHCFAQ